MGNLYEASRQWQSRPADERYESVEAMHNACLGYAKSAVTAESPWGELSVVNSNENMAIVGKAGNPAKLTHFAFGQLARTIAAPAEYLRALPTDLACQAVNWSMRQRDLSNRQLLIHKNGSMVVRAMTSEIYDRVWNFQLLKALYPLLDAGWRVPPARPAVADPRTRPATEADIIPNQSDFGLAIKVGDPIAPAGLYASDHDMFAFLVDPERSVSIGNRALMRGIFVKNSEVGDSGLSFKFFCLDNVCGNHIVWGSENVHEINVRHVGTDTLGRAVSQFQGLLKRYDDSGPEDERCILKSKTMILGSNKDDVIAAIVKYAKTHSLTLLGVRRVTEAYNTAERFEDRYGNPRSLFAMVAGLTQNSQSDFADERSDIDIQAGKLMQIAF